MNKEILKVEFRIDDDKMSDEEYLNQEEQVFMITKEMIYDLVSKETPLENSRTQSICQDNFYISKV